MSRFANLPRVGAAIVLLMVLAALGLGLTQANHIRDGRSLPGHNDPSRNDLTLYRAIVDRVKHGQDYDSAAVAEQRAGHYPLKPFIVVRPPALAIMLSWLPNEQVRDLSLAALGVVTMIACTRRLRALLPDEGVLPLTAIVLLLFSGVGSPLEGGLVSTFKQVHGAPTPGLPGGLSLLHESWAGLLIALSFILRTEKRFAASVVLGLLVALIRELAMPYLAVMAVIALMERRRWEALAFAGALAISLGALALHAQALTGLVRPDDLKSPGWVKFGGWNFILATTKWNLIAIAAGKWIAVILAPLALLGSLRFKGPFGLRLAAILFGYASGFMIIGRPENDYWGMLILPMSSIGLAISPWALIDLGKRLIAKDAGPIPATA